MTEALVDDRLDWAGTTWQDIVLSFLPQPRRTDRTRRRLSKLILPAILLLQVGVTWRLSNIAFSDEALYINAGHDILRHYLHGAPIAQFGYGTYFSGAPNAYPIVAGFLDGVGGLDLVRAFSTLCMVMASGCVYLTARRLFGSNVGLISCFLFAISGSVLFIGRLATYDAACLCLLALGLCTAVTRRSVWSGALVGAMLATAAVTKYAGAIFIPFVLVIGLAAHVAEADASKAKAVGRTVIGGLTTASLLGGGYLLWGSGIAGGVGFTTTSRKAVEPRPYTTLFGAVAKDVGLLTVLCITAVLALIAARSWRLTAVSLLCLLGGLSLPLDQIRIHEFVSLDKHTAFTALFLAGPAGFAVAWLLRKNMRVKLLAVALVWLVFVDGLWRSEVQYHGWPSSFVRTVAVIQKWDYAGSYVSLYGDTGRYYTTDPGVSWIDASLVYDKGLRTVLADVRGGEYAGFVYQSPQPDSRYSVLQTRMQQALAASGKYRLAAHFKVGRYQNSYWYVWIRTSAAAPA